jgi:hypothetical protein
MNPFVDGLHQFFGDLILESIEVRRSVCPLWRRQTLDHALTISCGGSSTAARVVGTTDGVRVEASASTGGRSPPRAAMRSSRKTVSNPGDNQTCKLDGKENPIDRELKQSVALRTVVVPPS